MISYQKISIVNKAVIYLIFLVILLFGVEIIYTKDVEKEFFKSSSEKAKFIILSLQMMNTKKELMANNENKLSSNISYIVDYYKIDENHHLIAFHRKTGKILYPQYMSVRVINKEIKDVISGKIEGRIETKNYMGYYFYFKPFDLSLLVYNDKKEVFYLRNILYIYVSAVFFFLILITIILEVKKARTFISLTGKIKDIFLNAVDLSGPSLELKEIDEKNNSNDIEDELIKSYNRMAKKLNMIVKRKENIIRKISKQRSNLRKLAYLYKKYSPAIFKSDKSGLEFVDSFSNNRIQITSLTFQIVNFYEQINKVYPEVISREIESLYRFIYSDIKSRGGFLNFFDGRYFNLIFGLSNNEGQSLKSIFQSAVITARDIHNWILMRNNKNNFSGVNWNEAIGIASGHSIIGVVGNSLMVLGDPVEQSKYLSEFAKDFGIDCVTDNDRDIKNIDFKYRLIDKKPNKESNEEKKYYEIFMNDDSENLDKVIKLYKHGLEMYFDGKYEIALSEFKKVNLLLKNDKPSLIFIDRINRKIGNG